MRRFAWLSLVLVGCSQSVGFSRGNMSGSHDIAMTDGYVFVTSADTNDLRVLQLTVPNSPQRTYVPAPNPLESLSIPTINRPTSLVIDDQWVGGLLRHGSYVFASRSGGAEISIVGADPSEFREVSRLATPGPVTATAAVKLDDTTSRLYFATFDGTQSTLFSIDLPSAPNALRALTSAQRTALIRVVVSLGSDAVVALLVVPPLVARTSDQQPFCDTGNHCLVVGSRQAGGTNGQTVMLDPVSLRTAVLGFPGPVRFLTTHNSTATDPQVRAGEHVFAILDEEKCGGSDCGGVIAVDTLRADSTSGGFHIAIDGTGAPMLPLDFGASLPVGLTIGVSRDLNSTDGGALRLINQVTMGTTVTQVSAAYAAVGVTTAANGGITFFDALRMMQIDGNDDEARAQNAVMISPEGYPAEYITGLDAGTDVNFHAQAITVADGVWRSQRVVAIWQAIISDTVLPVSGRTTSLAVPASVLGRVKLGDLVVFRTGSAACSDARITAINETGVTIDAVPADCPEPAAFVIRAGPEAPFTIFRESAPRYLGRAKAGDEFIWTEEVFVRLDGYNPSTPALRMGFGFDSVTSPPPRDSVWQFFIASGYAPFTFLIDTNTVGCAITQLPGTALFDEVRRRVYVVYPASNAIMDIDPALAQRVAVGVSQNTYCYQ